MKVSTLRHGLLAILILVFTFLTATEAKAVGDTSPPTGSIIINNGAQEAFVRTVSLTLSATDDSGTVTSMRTSNDNITWSSWANYSTTRTHTLTAGGGVKTVYVQFSDAAGNISYSLSDTILLDNTQPFGAITINGGDLYTSSVSAVYTIFATDNSGLVPWMRLSHDNVNWTTWEPYRTNWGHTITTGDGLKTVYVQFKDAVGNVSVVASDSIVLDRVKPTGTVLFEAGIEAVNHTNVILDLSATDNSGIVSQVRHSKDGSTWSAWEPYAEMVNVTLSAGEGVKVIYVQFMDAAGNTSYGSTDMILLDQTPPVGTILINNNAAATNSAAVTLNLSATDNYGVAVMVLENQDAPVPHWAPYATTTAWKLGAGDGQKTVTAKFIDKAGNVSSIVSDSIKLDQTPPVGTISINAGAAATNSAIVTLNLSATDNAGMVSQVRFSNDNVNWSTWSLYTSTKIWTLPAGDGIKSVFAQFRDVPGNISTAVSDTILFDQMRPSGTILINIGDAATNSTTVKLALSATDNSESVTEMRFSNDNVNWGAWSAYSLTKAWTLAAGNGLKTVYVQYKDAAGNISTTASDTITLDQTPPVGTILINNGAAATNLTAVTLNLSATDNSGVVSQMRFSYDSVNWSAWEAYAPTKAWTFVAGDSVKTVYAQFKDAAGNVSTVVSDTIRLDQTRPAGTILINGGASATNTIVVTLHLSAADNSGTVSQMRFSSNNVTWGAWAAYATTKAMTLTVGDGIKTVYVQFKDEVGNVSATSSDTIWLDQSSPIGTVSINAGAEATNSTAVTLSLLVTDSNGAVSQMRFSSDNVTWSPWSAYAPTKAWSLSAGEGIKTVYAQFVDAVGNVSITASDTIRLDQTPPAGTISINSGAATTKLTAATLTLSATDNSGTVSQMRFSNDNTTWSTWRTYAPTQLWTLSFGDGIKTVYVQFKDEPGNVSTAASDTIRLDLTPPTGSIVIGGGAGSTNSANTTLTLSAFDNSGTVAQMRFSNDSLTWSAWENYSIAKAWTLAAGDSLKTVYAQFKDAAGNTSIVVSDTISLDQTKPTGTVSINSGAAFATATSVTLVLSVTDNSGVVSQMRFSNDNVTWSAWSNYATTKAWMLGAGDGIKTVYAQFTDSAGNISTVATDTIRLDMTRPTGTISINGGAVVTGNTVATLTLSASDSNGTVSHMRVSNDNVNWSAWSVYVPTKSWTLAFGDGIKTVYVQFKDAAGNVSIVASDTIRLDLIPPTGTISINNGDLTTRLTAATLTLSALDNSGTVSQMRFSSDSVNWSVWSAYAPTAGWTLAAGDGVKTVYVQFKDAAGNVSIVASDTIRLDLIPPTGTISINNGDLTTKLTAATLTLSAADNSGSVSQMRFSSDSVKWTAWENYITTKAWTLAAGDGIKTIYVQFKDAAGNVSALANDTIRLDTSVPTGTIRVNNGAATTKLTSATLTLSATDNGGAVSQMRFSSDSVTWTAWENYITTKAWTLAAGDGIKTVYVQFKDAAGNVSAFANDTIRLDQTLPTGIVSINSDAATTKNTAATIAISAVDNSGTVSQMRFSSDNVIWSSWENYAPTKAWTLSSGEGIKNVYVQFADAAGNWSTIAFDSIRLDLTPPAGTISINGGAAYTNTLSVDLILSATDNNGTVYQMRFSNDNVTWSSWRNYSTFSSWTLPLGWGTKTVYVQFMDAVGNISASSSDTINLAEVANVSGLVRRPDGLGIPNVVVSINTTPTPRTATTDVDGHYIFSNIPSGSYQLTPSISGVNGALFYPAKRNITLGLTDLSSEDFKAIVTYSISGTVSYSGTKTGRVYLTADNDIGTSISSTGAFTIRGVEQGQFAINAFMDHIGDGRAHATSPSGSAVVTVGSSNVSGVVVTLTDPAPYVPAPPQIVSVSPSNGSAFIIWSPPYNSNGKEASDRVNIYYSTSPSVSPTNGTRIGSLNPMDDNFMYHQRGLVNGSVLYYVMTSEAGANISAPSNVIGPVTIGPRTDGYTVSGTVTSSGFAPTGSLIAGLYNKATKTFYYTSITSPAASQPYSVTGVPIGTYYFGAIYDMNNNGFFDAGDLSNIEANEEVKVTSTQIKNTTIAATDITGRINTYHYKDVAYEDYGLMFDFSRGWKFPVKIAVVSGPGMAGPLDIGNNSWGGYSKYYGNLMRQLLVGDTYTFSVTYLDGTTAIITRSLTGVVNSFPKPLTPSGPVPGATKPAFIWSAPSPAMPNATGYRINVYDGNGNSIWSPDQLIPITDLSAQFNFDGTANLPALTTKTPYSWQILVEDQFGNVGSTGTLDFTP